MIKYIEKRDGTIAKFNPRNIYNAIYQSAKASQPNDGVCIDVDNVLRLVVQNLEKRNQPTINIETVQDTVEDILMGLGYFKCAKAYITYRNMRDTQRNLSINNINVESSVEEYISKADWRVNANANQGYSLGGMILNIAGKVTANYWLNKIYPKEIGQAHRNGDIHIHDLDMLSIYCCGWSLKNVLREGMNGIAGKIESNPPKHLGSALNQALNHLCCCQNEAAGAQAYSSFDTYMAPFIRLDNLSYSEVKQHLQEFIYNLNVPSRWGTQTPFTNLTFDWVCPHDLQEEKPIIGGKECDFTYGDLQKEMDMINKAYIEVMLEGDRNGRVFTFPIPTYNITPDFNWDSENSTLLFEMTAKYGLPYFQNFINSELKPNMIRSMCPLSGDTRVLVKDKGKIKRLMIRDIKTPVYTFHCGEWSYSKPIKVEKQRKLRITLSSGDYTDFGEHHLQPVVRNNKLITIPVKNIKKGDWLPFTKHTHNTKKGSYELGFAIGAYLGDGSRDNKGISYTIGNKKGAYNTKSILMKFWRTLGYSFRTSKENRILRIRVGSNSFQVIKRFIIGTTALTKGISKEVYRLNIDARQGILDGLMATDGSRSKNRFYTSSIRLANDIIDLAHNLGKKALFSSVDTRTKVEGSLSDNPNYCISIPNRVSYGNFFKEYGDYNLYCVTDIEDLGISDDLYCFEVDNDEHLFTLANGLVTHNCRLQLDLRELLKRGNGLFGSAEQTGSIGVVTINCARLGYLFKGDKESLYKRLDYLMELARNSLELKRKTLKQNMDRGLYPYIARWLGTLRNHFSTIGVNGINEMIRNFTNDEEDITTEKGHAFAVEFLDHVRQNLLSYQSEEGAMYNLEATPAEGCFVGDTQILTIKGPKKIADLCGKEIVVLSKNKVTRKVEFKKARVFKTGTKPLVKVRFSNGLEIKCTSNHPFAVRYWNGRKGEDIAWVTAEELVKGDRISSVYHGITDAGYHTVAKKGYLHRLIWEYYNHKIPEGYVVHHKDFNKNNNKISNLELMSAKEHKAYHIREAQSRGKMLAGYDDKNPFYGKKHSFKSKLLNRFSKSGSNKKRDKYILDLFENGLHYAQIARLLNCDADSIRKCVDFYRKNGFNIRKVKACTYPKWNPQAIEYLDSLEFSAKEIANILKGKNKLAKVKSYLKFLHTKNHTVESVEYLNESALVYNMEVEDNHNYYVGNMDEGFVLVHNCTYRFAKEDKKRFPDIIQAGTEHNPYYTNSSQLPVGYTDDPFEALEMQDDLQRKYTGGTVLHLYMNEAISSSDACKKIVKRALTNFRLPYITITPTFSICPIHGYIKGQHEFCPKCDAELMAKKNKS